MKENTLQGGAVVGLDKKIPGVEKLFYSSIPGIGTFYTLMISTWLLFFYTDVLKIDALYVGAMFVLVRVIDAVISPFFGMYIDKQNTRWGKYKPWIAIVMTGTCVGGFFAFNAVDMGQAGNTIYATITYAIFTIFLTMNQGASTGMTTVMTKRQDDRLTIGVGAAVWVMIFAVIASVVALPLINLFGNGNQALGFRGLMLVFLVINMAFIIIIMKVSKERFVTPIDKQEKISFIKVFKSLGGNKYALFTIVYIFGLNLFSAVRQAVGIYYYKYYFNDENMLVLVGMITMVPTLVGAFAGAPFAKKIGLRATMLTGVIASIATSIPMYFLPATETGKLIFIILSVIGGLFLGMSQPGQGTMMPAAADYSEWKFKTNSGGFLGSVQGFFQTLSGAIAGGVTAFILAAVNYVPDVQQSTTTLDGIRFMMTLLPAIAFVFGLVMFGWDMSENKHKEIVEELKLRRESNTEKSETVETKA